MSIAKSTVTKAVAEYITSTQYEALPAEAISLAKQCIVDGTGVMLAGSTNTPAQIIRTYVKSIGGQPVATIIGESFRAPAALAALANGVSGHVLDYDDTQLSSSNDRMYGLLTHPTTPVLAAALACGQEEIVSGKKILEAFCVGFEVECKLAEAINPGHYLAGHHSTGTLGTFGATAAAAKIMRLDVDQVRNALGIAASKSAGIRANFGTMTKPYHAGAAAENGIVAARLAQLEYKANPDAFDGPWGFFQVTGGGHESDRIIGKLGNPHSIMNPGFSVKPYPCGSLAHPAMDTLMSILVEEDIQPDQIRSIRCGTTSHTLGALRYVEPEDALQAKFSLNFCLAILALKRQAGLPEFRDEVVRDATVRAMMKRVTAYVDPKLESQGRELMRSVVQLELVNGQFIERNATISRGMPQNPMSESDLRKKFTECASQALGSPVQIAQILSFAYNLDQVEDVNEYVELLTTNAMADR